MGEGLFREEALKHHTGARSSGDVLRVPPSWTRWTFAFLIAVFVAAAAYAILGSVTVYTRGLAICREPGLDGASVTVYFPERDRSSLTSGLVIRIEDPSDPRRSLRAKLVSVEPEPVPLALALTGLRTAAWPTAPPPPRLAIVRALLAYEPGATTTAGEVLAAEAPIGEESLLALLLPVFRSSRGD